MIKKGISEILLNAGVITATQAQECQQESGQSDKSFEQCLIEKQFAQPEAIAKALASYASVSYIDKITDKMADLELLAKVPLKFLRDNSVMPVMIDGHVTILTNNPLYFQPLDELNLLLGGDVATAVATQAAILDGINRYYPLEGSKQMMEELEGEEDKELGAVDFEAIEEKDILAMASEAPIIKLVNHILFQAAKRGASDIHIEPFEKEMRVRYRIDGVMYQVMTPPKRIQGALSSRIKIMADLNIAEKRLTQDGRIDLKIAGKQIDIRVSVLPTVFGERIVMRLLDKSRTFGKLSQLGFSERDLAIIMQGITKPNGIIYVTGPTGSGKTSTLYCVLGELNTPEVNIVTVEDPVEYQMTGVGQVAVRDKIGLTFAAALRSILRQDPDIVMIGETRDAETAQIAIQAALTGHLVLSTLHTNNAPASITRLLDMGVEPFLIASSVVLIMAQRLVRRLCEKCKVPYHPSKDLLLSVGMTEKEAQGIIFYEPKGCEECNQMGYRGRLAIFEMMLMTPAMAKLTMERADTSLLRKQALADGMTLLIADGVRKIKAGLTTIDEVLSVAAMENEMIDA
ncbi:MAG: type II secretion system ATPase GspE [Candidatus Babeliales bacterium]|nr:type II secretion system ATPase GspE [Candidatus Babeliales bacterium]